MRMRTWKSLTYTFATAGAFALLGAACGDDGDDHDHEHDAAVNDDGGEPDASIDAMPTATRSMTIAVTDVALTSPQAAAAGLRGGVVSIEFSDLTQGGGEVVYGTAPIGGCLVTKFDSTHTPNPILDAGTITVTGPDAGATGLLKPVGDCAFVAGLGYSCSSDGDTTASVVADEVGVGGLVTYEFTDQTLTANLVGSYLNINGFEASTGLNSGASAFPIVGQVGNQLTVVNPAGMGSDVTVTDAIAYRVLNGAGPIPTAAGANADFLGDETTLVRIEKDADANWPEIAYEVFPRGEGFELDDDSALPHAFPTTGAVTFSCGGTGGDCGADAAPTGTLRAIIVSGRTTDVDVTGLPDYIMPPASAATEYTAFQCAFFEDEVILPADAVAAIHSVDVTRLETRVLRVAGTTLDGPTALDSGLGKVLVGHGLVGHTTY